MREWPRGRTIPRMRRSRTIRWTRLRQRADNMATSAAAMKKIADAADPLYKTLDDGQKRRLGVLTHMERRFGGGWRHRERGMNRDRRLGS